jgi:hypothetical protein
MGKVKMKNMLEEDIGLFLVVTIINVQDSTSITYPYIVREDRGESLIVEDAEGYHTEVPKYMLSKIAVDLDELPSFSAYAWVESEKEIEVATEESKQKIGKYMLLMKRIMEQHNIQIKSVEDVEKIKELIRASA